MTALDGYSLEEKEAKVEQRRRRRARYGKLLPNSLLGRVLPRDPIEEFERRRPAVKSEYESVVGELRDLLDSIDDSLTEARTTPDPLAQDLKSTRIRISTAEDRVAELEALDDGYLSADERDRRTGLVRRLSALQDDLLAFEMVGRTIQTARARLDDTEDVLDGHGVTSWDPSDPETPPETLPTYLERDTALSAWREVARAARHEDEGYRTVREENIANEYLDELDGLRADRRGIETFLERYNDWYLEAESAQHESLFTDIDAAGHDLSDEQRAAVVRDDDYNLVVAGAGSGKTVTLTHRAAYLSQRDDRVLPADTLAITYTKNAAQVMQSRLSREFGIEDMDVGTFHKIGLDTIKEATGETPEIIDARDRSGMISRFIDQEMERSDSAFQREFKRFLRHYHEEAESPDLAEKRESYDELRESENETLGGETVDSPSEKRIADFLFSKGVDYEHRQPQQWFEKADGTGQFRPRFYLPEFDVVVLHYPVSESGEPTDWANEDDHEELASRVRWIRERISEIDHLDLVETYEFEYAAGRLPSALSARLPMAGVAFEELTTRELLERSYDESVTQSDIVSAFESFVVNAKQLNLTPDEVDERVTHDTTPRKEAFEQCAKRLFRRYVVELYDMGAIDLPDMLHRAADHMEDDPETYTAKYDQILVDEFQDISAAEVRFIKCFLDGDHETKLFCVGDDWQSIYSFSGSNVGYFIDFEEVFGEPARSDLTANYRCPETVVDAGDTLISNNDNQLEKETRPRSGCDTTIDVHDLETGPSAFGYRDDLVDLTVDLVERRLATGCSPEEVMVLSRTNVPYHDVEAECRKRGIETTRKPQDEDHPEECVRLFTVHKSKGDEAEHVIITHAVEDRLGFPWQIEENDLVETVRVSPEQDSVAEERRLFYVALTRTTGTLDVVSSANHRSRFLDEISQHTQPAPTVRAIGTNESRTDIDSASVSRLYDSSGAVAQSGQLRDWSGSRKFLIFDEEETEPLEADLTYRVEDARLSHQNGRYDLVLDTRTTVTPVE